MVICREHFPQQTFVLMKTSWRRLDGVFRLWFQRVSSRRLQDVLIKKNIFALVIRLQKTSLRRLSQDQYSHPGHTSSRRLQGVFRMFCQDFVKTSCKNVFKTSSRCLQDVLKTSSRRLAKTSSRRLAKMSSRHFQDLSSS